MSPHPTLIGGATPHHERVAERNDVRKSPRGHERTAMHGPVQAEGATFGREA